MPSTCRLVLDGPLIRRSQAPFHTRPGILRLARVEQGRLSFHKACQVGGEEIPLRRHAAWAGMPALREALLLIAPHRHAWESLARHAFSSTTLPPALAARRQRRTTNIPGAHRFTDRP